MSAAADAWLTCSACGRPTPHAFCGRGDCPGPGGSCAELGHFWIRVPETVGLKHARPMVRCIRQGCDEVGWDL